MDIYIGLLSKYLVLAAALVGTFLYTHYKSSKAKYFIWIVWFGFIMDLFGQYYYSWFNQHNSQIVYNIYVLVAITFFLWWFRSLLISKKRKEIVKYFIILFIISNMVNALFLLNVLYQPTTYAYVIGVIFLVITVCYYFIEMFNKEVVLKLRDSMYFWFALGVLSFFATFLPFYITATFFAQSAQTMLPLGVTVFILNVIMNGCFIIGFFKAKHSAKQHPLNQSE